MLRESFIHTPTWIDKTMTGIRERQLEACVKRVESLPDFGLFSGCTDKNVEQLYAVSYDAQEERRPAELITTAALRRRVASRLSAEAALLSPEEYALADRLIVFGGECLVVGYDETDAAESLVRRLWCTITRQDDLIQLHMPPELLTPLTLLFASPEHEELRSKLYRFDATVRGLLYIGGLLHYHEPLHRLMNDVLRGTYAEDAVLAMRFLRCAYDYTYDRRGDMLLLHPGLAEPECLLKGLSSSGFVCQYSPADLQGAVGGILPEEEPLADMMYGLLVDAVRPGLTEDQVVDDLRMLAKQGVSLQAMNEVLSSMLAVLPTPRMLDGVKQIYRQTPRWGALRSAMVQ